MASNSNLTKAKRWCVLKQKLKMKITKFNSKTAKYTAEFKEVEFEDKNKNTSTFLHSEPKIKKGNVS